VQCLPLPRSEDLADYYVSSYRQAGLGGIDVANCADFPRDNLFYLNRGRAVTSLLAGHLSSTSPQVVDIGAGWGHTLYALGERYPESGRVAIELSEPCQDHLRSMGVEVHHRAAEAVLPEMVARFDAAVISHVLEHLLRPRQMLDIIKKALRPHGHLYLEVPNIPADYLSQYPDNRWAPRYDEPHTVFFSRESLREMAQAAGFEVVFLDSAGPKYRMISALRYRLPPLRPWVEQMIPRRLFFALRRNIFSRFKVREEESIFRAYGGRRIWLRALLKNPEND
jgi:SAM-dependent methyltransferase